MFLTALLLISCAYPERPLYIRKFCQFCRHHFPTHANGSGARLYLKPSGLHDFTKICMTSHICVCVCVCVCVYLAASANDESVTSDITLLTSHFAVSKFSTRHPHCKFFLHFRLFICLLSQRLHTLV